MIWQITPYFSILIASAAIPLAIALYAWSRRKHSGIFALIFLMLTIAIWSIAYALELNSNELQLKLFFTGIEYIGITLLPVAWLGLAIEFSGNDSWLSSKRFVHLVILPVITTILVWTNGYHGLIYKDAKVHFIQGYPALEIVQGQWYWVNVAYSYALILIATLLVINAFIHSSKLYRNQALVLLIGAFIPWIANLAYLTGWHPLPYLDTTPLAFFFTGIAAAIGLLYFGLLDIMPVARNIVIENISEGIIVLDSNNRILDMNSAALKMTGLNLNQSIGQSATNLLSSLLTPIENLLESSGDQVKAHIEKEVLAEGENRYYNLSVSPIYGLQGDLKARILLIQDITSRKIAEIRLKESEETALTLLNAPLDAAYLLDEQGKILALSDAGARSLGKSVEDLKGTYAFDLFSPDVRQKRKESVEYVFKSGKPIKFEDERDGRYFNNLILPVFNEEGMVTKTAIFVSDITDRKQAEDRILASLKEKEVLLKEVHHRVKNNLQIISALLYLQSSYLTDENIIKIFTDSQNRIKSMALVHENLYRSKDLDRVDFNEYINKLVSHLSDSYGDLASKINFKVNSEKIYLNINTAIPCGMIINELVSNSLKHAFQDGRRGEVCIDLSSEDDGFRLVVSDNGIGIKDIDIEESKTLGFRLIEILVKQIDGTMRFDTNKGFRCEIHFKGLK